MRLTGIYLLSEHEGIPVDEPFVASGSSGRAKREAGEKGKGAGRSV